MLIFNKLRTQQALGGLEISKGSGGGFSCGSDRDCRSFISTEGEGTAEAGGAGREFAFFGQPWAQAQSEDERDGVGRARGENSCLKMCKTAGQGP